jgi:hypothetical protein
MESAMQRYFLHLKYLDKLLVDPDGSEHNTLGDARDEAEDAIRILSAEHLRSRQPLALQSVRICDTEGNLLAEVFTSETLRELVPPALLAVPTDESHN